MIVNCPLGQDYKLAQWEQRCSRVLNRKPGAEQGRKVVGKLAMGELEDAAMEVCRKCRLGANSKPELLSCYLKVVVCEVKTKSLCCFFASFDF